MTEKDKLLKIMRKIWKDMEEGLTDKRYEEGYKNALKTIHKQYRRVGNTTEFL